MHLDSRGCTMMGTHETVSPCGKAGGLICLQLIAIQRQEALGRLTLICDFSDVAAQ